MHLFLKVYLLINNRKLSTSCVGIILAYANTFQFAVVGGILFKVYIVGEAIKVVRRFSLPDVSKQEWSKNAGVFRFPRVSCAAASADDADLDPSIAGKATNFMSISHTRF